MAAKTERTAGCWIWRGAWYAGEAHGYGAIAVSGKNELAHRVAWILERGPIPDGLDVCHRCDNRRCVRPSHLFLGTHADNSADMVQKGRSAKGERVHQAKLTAADVRRIRRTYTPRRKSGPGTLSALARQFGVDRTAIYLAVHAKTWRHV